MKRVTLLLLCAIPIFAQIPKPGGGGGGAGGTFGQNATAASVPAVTSLLVQHNLNTTNIVYDCWTSSVLDVAPLTPVSVTVSDQSLNTVTFAFSSTANVRCNVNGGTGAGPAGQPGVAGPTGPAVVIGSNTLVVSGTPQAPQVEQDSTSVPRYSLGTGPPTSTCVGGSEFYTDTASAGNDMYRCSADNTWVLLSPGGATVILQFMNTGAIKGSIKLIYDDASGIIDQSNLGATYHRWKSTGNSVAMACGAGNNLPFCEIDKDFLFLGDIYDNVGGGNGGTLARVVYLAGASNHLSLNAALAGFNPSLKCRGIDANVGCEISGKGSLINYLKVGDGTMNGVAQYVNGVLSPVAGVPSDIIHVDGSSSPDQKSTGGVVVGSSYYLNLPPLNFTTTANVTVANTTSQTSLVGSTYSGTATICPNCISIGQTFTVKAGGTYGVAGSVPTLTVVVSLGGTTLATFSPTLIASDTGTWSLEGNFKLVSPSSISGRGTLIFTGGSTPVTRTDSRTATGIDMTTNQTVDVKCTWGTASASNTLVSLDVSARL